MIKSLKGTRDFYPDFQRKLNYIFENWRKVAKVYGFEEYEGPYIESFDLFSKKSGEEIEAQIYAFEDKGGRKIAIRPEITPTLARMIIQKAGELPKPIRWFSIPRLNRYERPQKGRLREFFQFNIDIIGEDSILSDFEVIGCAIDSLRIFGLTKDDFVLKFNNRKSVQNILESLGFNNSEIAIIYKNLDKKGKIPDEVLWDNLKKELNGKDIGAIEELFGVGNSIEALRMFVEKYEISEDSIIDIIEFYNFISKTEFKDYIEFDISIVRGLAYYTDIVFEIYAKGENLRAIAGGGRYNKLISLLSDGKVDLPAVGFGIGDAVLLELLSSKGLIPDLKYNVDFYGIYFTNLPSEYFLNIIHKLRENGYSVIYSLKREKISKQFKNADKYNAKYALIIGDEEEEKEMVKIKDLKTSKERTMFLTEFYREFNIK